jgi:hypothetical protein
MLSRLAARGKKVLFVSGEMDEIGHFKYCRRMPHFKTVPTLFLKNYTETIRETMEFVLDNGYDVVYHEPPADVAVISGTAIRTGHMKPDGTVTYDENKG